MTPKHELDKVGVAILAGGLGTRLSSVLYGKPKALAPLAGRPLLAHQLELLSRYGRIDSHFFIHHLADEIETFVGNGERWNIKTFFYREKEPRGTAGAVLDNLDRLPETFFVFYGDTLLDVDLGKMLAFHRAKAADATLLVHPNDHPFDSDIVEVDDHQRIRQFFKTPHPPDKPLPNLVNAALYVLQRDSLKRYSTIGGKLDFARDLFPKMISEGLSLAGYRSREYIKDMGTPSRLQEGEKDLQSGKVKRMFATSAMPAVFLDRDGTIIIERDHLKDPSEVQLLPGAGEAVRLLNEHAYLSVVVTNQPVVARGECSFQTLSQIHNQLEVELGAERAYLDRIYFCPHHPDRGFAGEIPELKRDCECRKPKPGLIKQALTDLHIDATTSWMIGDTTTDIAAGAHASCRTILVRTGFGGRDYKSPSKPDFVFYDLHDAVRFICTNHDIQAKIALDLAQQHADVTLIFLSGASRSGKSTWASILRYAFQSLGRKTHIVPTDSWLFNESARGTSVLERHDVKRLQDSISNLVNSRDPVKLPLPWYDRVERKLVTSNCPVLSYEPGDLLIVEGVIASPKIFPGLLKGKSITVDVEDKDHRQRFEREYRFRGLKDDEIQQLWQTRELPEQKLLASISSLPKFTLPCF